MTEAEKKARLASLKGMREMIDDMLAEEYEVEAKGEKPEGKPKMAALEVTVVKGGKPEEKPEEGDDHDYEDGEDPCEKCGKDSCECEEEKPAKRKSMFDFMAGR